MRIEFENKQIPIYTSITEDDERIDTPETIQRQLKTIAENLGYQYIETSSSKLGKGIISITNDVDIIIKYGKKLSGIYVAVGVESDGKYRAPMYNCTNNSSDIEDTSVALQTASMICSDIRRKLM